MKFSGKSIVITILLLLVLIIVVYLNIALFISGPAIKQQSKNEAVLDDITEHYKYVTEIERHSFRYVTYIGESKTSYYWFDAKGELLLHRKKEELDFEKIKQIANEVYGIQNASISLGYGYQDAVYVIHDGMQEIYLDLSSLKEVGRLEGQ